MGSEPSGLLGTDLVSIGASGAIVGTTMAPILTDRPVARAVSHNEPMSATEEGAAGAQLEPHGPAHLSSIIALALGVLLSIGVSGFFGLVGWGGELASQTAGAASGAAPLIIDGVRQRRVGRRARPSLLALRTGKLYRPKLFIASALGFGVLLIDTVAGFFVYNFAELLIDRARGDKSRAVFVAVYATLGAVITLPAVMLGTYLLGIAAGHRLGEQRQRRWILFGVGIYTIVRVAQIIASGPSAELNMSMGVILGGVVVTVPLIVLFALLGARRARKTQSVYYAKVYFGRLAPADQEAALALLDESVATRRI